MHWQVFEKRQNIKSLSILITNNFCSFHFLSNIANSKVMLVAGRGRPEIDKGVPTSG